MRQPWRCFRCGAAIYTADTDVCPNCDECPYPRSYDILPRRTPAERETWKNIDSLTKLPMIMIGINRRLNKTRRKPPWEI